MDKLVRLIAVLLLLVPAPGYAASPAAPAATPARKPGDYPLTADSLPQPGVPSGRLEGPFLFHSQVIENTWFLANQQMLAALLQQVRLDGTPSSSWRDSACVSRSRSEITG